MLSQNAMNFGSFFLASPGGSRKVGQGRLKLSFGWFLTMRYKERGQI